jgi:hypothetical protein
MYTFLVCSWKNNAMMLMSNLIVPFTIGGIVIGTSIVLSFLQVSCHQLLFYWIIMEAAASHFILIASINLLFR